VSGSPHFSLEASGEPTSPGRFVDSSEIVPLNLIDGLEFRPIIGERMLANVVHFDSHSTAPLHVHEEEQIVIVLEGEFDFEIDGAMRTMRHGDIAVIPAWVPHGAHTNESTCLEVDVFNPPRETLLEHAVAQRDAIASAQAPSADSKGSAE
jgi:quercetin dioxygenase-like cupin family protein